MASRDPIPQPEAGGYAMSVETSLDGRSFTQVQNPEWVDGPDVGGVRSLQPSDASLAKTLEQQFRAKGVSSSKAREGVGEAKGLLYEYPWAGGTSDTTQVHADGQAVTLHADLRLVRPNTFTLKRGEKEEQPEEMPISHGDPIIFTSGGALVFPEKSLTGALRDVFLKNESGTWVPGTECVQDIKTAISTSAAAGSMNSIRGERTYLNTEDEDTVIAW